MSSEVTPASDPCMYICICKHVCMYVCVCIYVCVCVCVSVCVCTYIHIYTYIVLYIRSATCILCDDLTQQYAMEATARTAEPRPYGSHRGAQALIMP